MEYFDGQTLQDHVEKKGTIPIAEALGLARILAEALAAAHGQNVLHRDVKPANVMVKRLGTGWEVRLIDFGLAMRSSVLAESISTGRGNTVYGASIAGTLDYAAPEQLGKLPGVKVGPPADVYGFAKTLCFALFQTAEQTIKHYKSVPDPIAELIGHSRDPKERPQTFQQVISALAAPVPPPIPRPLATPPPLPPIPQPPLKLEEEPQAPQWADDDDADENKPNGSRAVAILSWLLLGVQAVPAGLLGMIGLFAVLFGRGGPPAVHALFVLVIAFTSIANFVYARGQPPARRLKVALLSIAILIMFAVAQSASRPTYAYTSSYSSSSWEKDYDRYEREYARARADAEFTTRIYGGLMCVLELALTAWFVLRRPRLPMAREPALQRHRAGRASR